MLSFNDFISELRTNVAVKPPFFIAVKQGSKFYIKDEITSDNPDVQQERVSGYKDAWIIPGREAGDLNIGDTLTRRDMSIYNGVPVSYFFTEEVQELTEVAAKKKIRVLKGKRVVQYRCPPGHHKKKRGSKICVRTTGKRKYKVSRGAKKAARKRKARKTTISRKRGRSMRKRRGMGL